MGLTPTEGKPERRAKRPPDIDADDDIPAPSQQSQKAGPGTGGGREASRRTPQRAPKVAGGKAHQKSNDTTMMSRDIEKKLHAKLRAADAGETPADLAAPEDAIRGQPRRKGAKKQSRADKAAAQADGASKRAAAPAEAAQTQEQVLRDKPAAKTMRRDEGVDTSE